MKPFIPHVLDLNLTYNTGAAWSMFSGMALALAILRLAAGIGFLYYVLRNFRKITVLHSVCFTLIATGAIGNAMDGLRIGKVVDMFYSHQLSWLTQKLYGQPFPIFNVADSCVVSGVVLLLLSGLFERKKSL